jgi:hypothetical protein
VKSANRASKIGWWKNYIQSVDKKHREKAITVYLKTFETVKKI